MEGISFATKGVTQLLEQVFKLDTQDFLFKMQGYALQGIVGEL